ncbi:protein TWIN LOV 1-like isoform X2 [Macadamia integrifolia]|uniref:protein TWIN LOV 1-like isoform X2 n=1 Tax=Macadamia integrifolia TaxID=60698 RepID=UPI001C5303DD|nr:protein TWIN LOV 1-like isoform X2 [Macadamia integrifolia]
MGCCSPSFLRSISHFLCVLEFSELEFDSSNYGAQERLTPLLCAHGIGIHPHNEHGSRRARRRRRPTTVAMESQLALVDQSLNARYSSWVREALDDIPDCFTITDPSISGHPIVFASREFLKMSCYSKDEVIGRNARMFQGPETNRKSVMEIREAIREERTIQLSLLNYRKDGTPFWLLFHLSPIFCMEDGRVVHFVAVQLPIARKSMGFSSGFGRNDCNFDEAGSRLPEIVFGSCRKEVCLDSVTQSVPFWTRGSFHDLDNRGLEVEDSCEASDLEKQKAATSINNILSVLTHYSELTGKLVCGKRTDPQSPDMPIVYASDAFLKLTGYARHEVLGKNCKFLNGPDTDTKVISQIRESIQTEQACTVCLLNYRKDGSSFWNRLHISPVRNASGKDLHTRKTISGGREKDGLYYLNNGYPPSVATTAIGDMTHFQWHCRLGHLLLSRLQLLFSSFKSVPRLECEACELGKHHRVSFPSRSMSRSSSLFSFSLFQCTGSLQSQ